MLPALHFFGGASDDYGLVKFLDIPGMARIVRECRGILFVLLLMAWCWRGLRCRWLSQGCAGMCVCRDILTGKEEDVLLMHLPQLGQVVTARLAGRSFLVSNYHLW